MLKKIFTFLCLLASLTTQAQNADTRIGTLMNESRWFDLERSLKATPSDSIHPLLHQMAVALTHHYFNRPDSACLVLADLLNNHQQELGGNTLNMAILWGTDLARSGQYAPASDLMQSLYEQLTAQGVDSTQAGTYQILARQWKALAEHAPLCRPLHPTGTYRIPMGTDNEMHKGKAETSEAHFITMDGSINGREARLVFDTGAGVNVITPNLAKHYGLRLLATSFPMAGIGIQQGQSALADTLRIGDMTWTHVPFVVVDTRTGNAEADHIGGQLPPVIGLPILLRMQEIQLDFANHEFVIPATPTPNPLDGSNLLLTDSEDLRLATTDQEGNALFYHLDTGGYYTNLLPRWYESHQEEVKATGTPDSLRVAGIGAAHITRSYLLPRMEFRIGNGTATLDSVTVNTGIGLHDNQSTLPAYLSGEEDGTIGLDLLEQFERVILNLKEMYLEAVPSKKEK